MAVLLPAWPALPAGAATSIEDIYAPYRAMTPVMVQPLTDRTMLRQVSTLALDRSGRVWAGGYANLVQFDGARSRVYPARQTPGLGEANIRALLPLANGDLLVGANREGLVRWRLGSGAFEPMAVAGGGFISRVNMLSPARDGGVWISAEQGLYYWNGADPAEVRRVDDAVLDGAESPRVLAALERADGALWVAAHKGVYVRERPAGRFAPLALPDAALQRRVANESVWTLAEDGLGRMWLGLVRSGAVVVGEAGQAFAPQGLDGTAGLHKGSTVRALLWHRGQMWVGTDGEGLLACADACAAMSPVPVNLRYFEGRRNFHVRTLAADPRGRIWAASDRGMFHFEPQPRGIFELDITPPGRDPRQQFSEARSVLHDSRGRLWVGMWAGEVMVLDLPKGTRRLLQLPAPLSASGVEALGEDARGRIWAAGRGVAWIDPDSLQARPAGPLAHELHRYTDLRVQGEKVWLGHYDGLIEAGLDGRVLHRLEGTRGSGLETSQLVSLGTGEGGPWLGTPLGLHALDTTRWTASLLLPEGSTRAQLPEQYINAIEVGANGLWAGTSDGLLHQPRAGEALRLLGQTRGLDVRGMVDGKDGTWFAAVPAQVGQLDRAGRLKLFRSQDGVVPANGFARRGMVAGPGGSLVVATGVGLLVIDPVALQGMPAPVVDLSPGVVALSIDGVARPGDGLPGPGAPLQLEPDQQRMNIEFAVRDYMALEKQRFSYRLQGYDSGWVEIPPDASPQAAYGRLPAGEYQLDLRVTSLDWPGQEWITTVPVKVRPYWYQRTDVRLLVSALLVGLLAAGFWLRDLRNRKRRLALERLVAQRTGELEDANRRLDQLAGEDVLTGLHNRRRLFQRLRELAAAPRRPAQADTLLLLDFDHFKQINDNHGHQAGDAVLSEAARRIRSQLRAEDFAGRYGGEELMIVLPHTGQAQAQAFLSRLREVLRATPIDADGTPLQVTVSIGVAESLPGEDPDQWVARADKALYQAKADGRDCVRWAPAGGAGA